VACGEFAALTQLILNGSRALPIAGKSGIRGATQSHGLRSVMSSIDPCRYHSKSDNADLPVPAQPSTSEPGSE